MRRLVPIVALGAACGGGTARPDGGDAAIDAYVVDDARTQDGAPLTAVDLAASGCALMETGGGDAGAPIVTCTGPAPLTVAFTGLAAGAVDTWAWTFGDGGASADAAPVHTFAAPGAYDVTVSAAGPGGTATATHAGYIVVTTAPLAAPCTDDAQCATGACRGMCTASCALDACVDGACARLGGAWDGPWCVRACADDAACALGQRCEVVADDEGGWIRACVPAGTLAPMGASCVDGGGAAQDGACGSGWCLAIGARGACAVDCASGNACPDGTACAQFVEGTVACLPTCGGDGDCGDDPWLGCEAPGASGPWGFDASGSVCAPRSCGDASACPGGACVDGYCAAL